MSPPHPAEHRALRELHVAARQVGEHWPALARRLGDPASAPLSAGGIAAQSLAAELEALAGQRDVDLGPASGGLGAGLGTLRAEVVDRTLERNQALRVAAQAAAHLTLLLGYVCRLAATRGDAELEAFAAAWGGRADEHERAVRAAAVACADDPDGAVQPAVPGPSGRAGHVIAQAMGSLGEAVDRAAASLRAR